MESLMCKEKSDSYAVNSRHSLLLLLSGNCTVPSYHRNGWWLYTYQYPHGTSVPHNTRLQVRCNWRFRARQSSLQCNDGTWSDSDDVKPLCEGSKFSPC